MQNRILLRLLDRLYRQLRSKKSVAWNRCLPFAELLVDRWEKSRFLGFGEKTSIYDSSYIFGQVKVGQNSWIGPFTILDGAGGLEIGDFCSISAGVQIYTHDSVAWALSGGQASYEYGPVKIGDRCYLGPNTIVARGVTIGSGSVIGANSLVLHSIPENSRAWGTPCRVVGDPGNVLTPELTAGKS